MTRASSTARRTLAALALAFATAGTAAPSPRIGDDYPRALALARERGVPILVEVWAPW